MRFSSPPNQQAYYEQVWQLVRQIPRGKVAVLWTDRADDPSTRRRGL